MTRRLGWFALFGLAALGGLLVASREETHAEVEAPSQQSSRDLAREGEGEVAASPSQTPLGEPLASIPVGDLDVRDAANPMELHWARRNLAFSPAFLEKVRSKRQPLSSVNPDDGFSLEELAVAYEGALDPLVRPDQRRMAIALLEEAATQGSIQALSSLGQLRASGEHRSPIEAEAHFLLAEMRGDWSVGMRFVTTDLLYSLDTTERSIASLRAHEILAEINRIRSERGQPPLGVDPRPGIGRAMQTIRTNSGRELTPRG